MNFLRRGSAISRAADDGDRETITPGLRIGLGGAGSKAEEPAAQEEPTGEAPQPDRVEEPQPEPVDEAAIRAEERQRVADVFASDQIAGREQAAVMLLTETDMAADRIIAKLPTLTPASANAMLANLANNPNPDLAPGTESSGEQPKASARILAAQRGLTGRKPADNQ